MTAMTRFRISGASALILALMLGGGTTVLGQAAQDPQRLQQAPAQQGMGPGMTGQAMGPGMTGQGMGPGMMGQGMGPGMTGQGMGPGMTGQGMGPGMMGQGMGPGMMGQGMGPGMMGQGMGSGMTGQAMGPGMMGQGMGPGMMGQGGMPHIGPHMMSPGQMHEMMEHMAAMMGQGMGPGTVGPAMGGWSGLEGRRVMPTMQLSTDDVRTFFERHLAMLGNERLKVGSVEAMDDDTITAEIVTVDDSLVESFEVDRHTGLISAAG